MHCQVMAPVRETAAQAVGAAIQPLPQPCAQALLALLHQLIKQQQWDVRHGGLLGLKYLLAARPHDSQTLMPQALPAAILGLQVLLPINNTFSNALLYPLLMLKDCLRIKLHPCVPHVL